MQNEMKHASDLLAEKAQDFQSLKSGERHNRLYGLAITAWHAGYDSEEKLYDELVDIYKGCAGGADYQDCEATAAHVARMMAEGGTDYTPAKRKQDKELAKKQDAHAGFFRDWCKTVLAGEYPMMHERYTGTMAEAVKTICTDQDAFYFVGNLANDKSVTAYSTTAKMEQAMEGSVYVCFNPLKTMSRTVEQCKRVDYLVLEIDEALADTTADKYTIAWYNELCAQQCKLWSKIITENGLPVRAATYSGGKSVHILVPVKATVAELDAHRARLAELYNDLHLDTANIDPVRKTRLPGGLRWYVQSADGRILDEVKYTTLVKALKSKTEAKKGQAYAELDKYGMTDAATLQKGYIEQDLLYLDSDAEAIDLERLEQILQSIVDEFILKSENAYEDAILKHEKIPMSYANFVDYLAHTHRTLRMNDITREAECSGWRNNDIKTIANQIYDDWEQVVDTKSFMKIERNIEEHLATDRYNPVTAWLEGLTWDGTDRLPVIYDILGITGDMPKTLVRKWLLQCVAMAYNDGHTSAEGVLTLIGRQRAGKSTFFKKLVPAVKIEQWFTEGESIDTDSKDDISSLSKGWIHELGEVDSTTKKEQSALKAVITAAIDKYRPAYGRTIESYPRHVSLCASVNCDDYLRDTTGNRRWWSIKIEGKIKLDIMDTLDIGQLWAQMHATWQAEGPRCYWLTDDELDKLNRINDGQRTDAGYEDELRYKYDFGSTDRKWVVFKELCDELAGEGRTMSKTEKSSVKKSLEAMGIEIKHTKVGLAACMPPAFTGATARHEAIDALNNSNGGMPF